MGSDRNSNSIMLLYVLVTYKDEENQKKIKVLEWSQHYKVIFRCSRAVNSVAGGWVWLEIKLIQTYIEGIVICKNEEDPLKMKVLEWSQ